MFWGRFGEGRNYKKCYTLADIKLVVNSVLKLKTDSDLLFLNYRPILI